MSSVKDEIERYVRCAIEGEVTNPDKKNNVGKVLFNLYVWQEISTLSDKMVKNAWERLVEEKLVKDDDHYRETPGETLVLESNTFSVLMKVSEPRKTLDKEAFLDMLAKKLRIARPAVDDLWEKYQTKKGKASLSKKVLEV